MNSKVITPLFIILFIVIFSIFNFSEYKEFHQENNEIEKQKLELKKELKKFNLEKIRELKNTQIYYTPDKSLLDNIVLKIDNSKELIYIEVYILTEKRIRQALIRAKKRGINIKIILEKNPYKATNINNKAFKQMKKAGIEIVWSNPKNYSLNHTKLLLIDDLSIISTGNLSYSTFTKNRDFFVFTKDTIIYEKLKNIFIADFNGNKNIIYDHNLVLSPNYTRTKFETLINGAESSIKMYFQYFKDEELKNLLIVKAMKGDIDIKTVVNKASYEGNLKEIEEMRLAGIEIVVMEKNKMHSKAILIDEKYLFLGSINFSSYSIDKNREIGILLKNKIIIEKFINIFNADLQNKF